jgi:hexosaminidase
VTLEDVYRYEPVPAELAPEQARFILGAQLNAWTEHMRLPARVEHQVFPRLAAIAEVTWSPAATRDWPGFLDRLPVQFARDRHLGIGYADTAFEPRARQQRAEAPGRLQVELSNQAQYGEIRYTLDGSPAAPGSTRYQGSFETDAGTLLRAATYAGDLLLASGTSITLGPQLRRRTDQELGQCTGNLVLRLEDDAPLAGARANFNVDIIDPCWIWPDVDLSRQMTLRAAVGQVPFNFQIGADADAIRRGDARGAVGEFEVRIGGCEGEPVAVVPLTSAADRHEITILPPMRLPARAGRHDLCLRFARPAINPIWAIQWVELDE